MAAIFLDLDGTLTDPQPGITRSIRYAMEKMEQPLPDDKELDWTIGPSLWESFRQLGLSEEDLDKAIGYYRERYTDVGLFENRVYDGIPEALESLVAAKHSLYLATAKPHAYAVKITAHFGLTPFLKTEYGAELNGTRSDKSELLRYALKSSDIDASDAIMVGDRKHDMLAASANGITTLGVLWGYGSKDELQSAHAEYLISSPQQLNPIISDWAS